MKTFQKVKRVVAIIDGRQVYGTYPYSDDGTYSWFSHWNGNSRDCIFLFDNKSIRHKSVDIVKVEEFEI